MDAHMCPCGTTIKNSTHIVGECEIYKEEPHVLKKMVKLDARDMEQLGRLCTVSRDRGPGGISSEDFPSKARSAFAHNAIVCALSHGEVPCHRLWTFPFVYEDVKSSRETPKITIELPNKMYTTILCNVKCPMTRPQRYSTIQKPSRATNHKLAQTE